MRPGGWRHRVVTELSRFPCRRHMYMPGSQTTRGGASSRASGPDPVAFCCHGGIGAPDYIAFAAHNLARTHPCQRFPGHLAALTHDFGAGVGRYALHRNGLLPSTSCRSPGAPRLNGWPMRSPVNASSASSRIPTMNSGPMRFATPSSQRTFTAYSLPVSTGAPEIPSSHAAVNNTFNLQRHLISAQAHSVLRAEAMDRWRTAAAIA